MTHLPGLSCIFTIRVSLKLLRLVTALLFTETATSAPMRCSTDFGTDALTVYQYFPRPRTYFDHCTHACTLFFYADAVADACYRVFEAGEASIGWERLRSHRVAISAQREGDAMPECHRFPGWMLAAAVALALRFGLRRPGILGFQKTIWGRISPRKVDAELPRSRL